MCRSDDVPDAKRNAGVNLCNRANAECGHEVVNKIMNGPLYILQLCRRSCGLSVNRQDSKLTNHFLLMALMAVTGSGNQDRNSSHHSTR